VVLYKEKGAIFLSLIRHYLLVKTTQAELFLDNYDMDNRCRGDAWGQLRQLNQKGMIGTVQHTIDLLLETWELESSPPEFSTSGYLPGLLMSQMPDSYVGVYWNA
jgi:hypothetical protein